MRSTNKHEGLLGSGCARLSSQMASRRVGASHQDYDVLEGVRRSWRKGGMGSTWPVTFCGARGAIRGIRSCCRSRGVGGFATGHGACYPGRRRIRGLRGRGGSRGASADRSAPRSAGEGGGTRSSRGPQRAGRPEAPGALGGGRASRVGQAGGGLMVVSVSFGEGDFGER